MPESDSSWEDTIENDDSWEGSIEDDSGAVNEDYQPKADSSWENTIEEGGEQDYLAEATEKADVAYEENKPGFVTRAAKGLSSGISSGFDIESGALALSKKWGVPVEDAYDALMDSQRMSEAESGGEYGTGKFVGQVAQGFIPGGALVRGAPVLKNAAKLFGIGALEGAGTTEGGLEERAKGAVTHGTANALFGTALDKGLDFAKGFLPGTTSSPRFVNKLVAKGSRLFGGADEGTEELLKDSLNDPKVLANVLRPAEETMKDIPRLTSDLSESFKDLSKQVGKQFEERQARAFAENVRGAGILKSSISELKSKIDHAIKKVEDLPDYYSPILKKQLAAVKGSLELRDPEMYGHKGHDIDEVLKAFGDAVSSGDEIAMKKIAPELKDIYLKYGGAINRAKQRIGDKVDWEKLDLRKDEQKLLTDLYQEFKTFTHKVLKGGEDMTKADKLYKEYKQSASPFMEYFEGSKKTSLDGISPARAGKLVADSGGMWTRGMVKSFENNAREFFTKHGIDTTKLDETVGGFKKLKNIVSLNRLSGQTGTQTGRSTKNAVTALTAGAMGYLSGGPQAGMVALGLVGALTYPSMSPTNYIKMLHATRQFVSGQGESRASKFFGTAWPAVRQAISRQDYSDIEMLKDIQDEVSSAIKEAGIIDNDKQDQGEMQGASKSNVSPKIQDFLRKNNSGEKLGSNDKISSKEVVPYNRGDAPQKKVDFDSGYRDYLPNPLKHPAISPSKSTLSGRIGAGIDELSFSDKIGLDPGEKEPNSQPNIDDKMALIMPMFFGITKKVTKLDLAMRMKLLKKKGKDLNPIDKERLSVLESAKTPDQRQDLIDSINDKVDPKDLSKKTTPAKIKNLEKVIDYLRNIDDITMKKRFGGSREKFKKYLKIKEDKLENMKGKRGTTGKDSGRPVKGIPENNYKNRYPLAKRNLSKGDIDRLDELYFILNRSSRDDIHWNSIQKEINKILGRK